MVLVLFCLILFVLIVLVLLSSSVRVKIEKLFIKDLKTNNDYKIYLQVYFFNKIKIFSKKININNLIKKENKNNNINIYKKINEIKFNKETLKILLGLKPKVENLDFNMNIGYEDACIVAYLVAGLKGLISIILPFVINKKSFINYIIKPVFNKNVIEISLNCIISFKIVHIICVICKLRKKGRKEYERTSNRRFNAYSYE